MPAVLSFGIRKQFNKDNRFNNNANYNNNAIVIHKGLLTQSIHTSLTAIGTNMVSFMVKLKEKYKDKIAELKIGYGRDIGEDTIENKIALIKVFLEGYYINATLASKEIYLKEKQNIAIEKPDNTKNNMKDIFDKLSGLQGPNNTAIPMKFIELAAIRGDEGGIDLKYKYSSASCKILTTSAALSGAQCDTGSWCGVAKQSGGSDPSKTDPRTCDAIITSIHKLIDTQKQQYIANIQKYKSMAEKIIDFMKAIQITNNDVYIWKCTQEGQRVDAQPIIQDCTEELKKKLLGIESKQTTTNEELQKMQTEIQGIIEEFNKTRPEFTYNISCQKCDNEQKEEQHYKLTASLSYTRGTVTITYQQTGTTILLEFNPETYKNKPFEEVKNAYINMIKATGLKCEHQAPKQQLPPQVQTPPAPTPTQLLPRQLPDINIIKQTDGYKFINNAIREIIRNKLKNPKKSLDSLYTAIINRVKQERNNNVDFINKYINVINTMKDKNTINCDSIIITDDIKNDETLLGFYYALKEYCGIDLTGVIKELTQEKEQPSTENGLLKLINKFIKDCTEFISTKPYYEQERCNSLNEEFIAIEKLYKTNTDAKLKERFDIAKSFNISIQLSCENTLRGGGEPDEYEQKYIDLLEKYAQALLRKCGRG